MQKLIQFKEPNIGIIKLTVVIAAGRIHETIKLQSICTAKLIGKGTRYKTASEINLLFDFYGASFDIDAGYDDVRISLTCLKKHFTKLADLFFESIFEAAFNSTEFELMIQTRKEKLKQIISRNDYLADRYLGEQLFGKNHPYGYAAEPVEYDQIQIEDIQSFYKKNYSLENAYVVLAGDVDDEIERAIYAFNKFEDARTAVNIAHTHQPSTGVYRYAAPQPLQASIKMGWNSIHPTNPDYPSYYLVYSILGGYFGSRLMQSLREEKGFTYGVYAQINSLQYDTYTSISTEVNRSVIDDTISSIQACFEELHTQLIEPKELNLVKQYLKGEFLRETDGAFRKMEVYLKMKPFGLNENFFVNLLNEIDKQTAQDVMSTAQKYFKFEQCCIVIV